VEEISDACSDQFEDIRLVYILEQSPVRKVSYSANNFAKLTTRYVTNSSRVGETEISLKKVWNSFPIDLIRYPQCYCRDLFSETR
jgi:hypothetical protein